MNPTKLVSHFRLLFRKLVYVQDFHLFPLILRDNFFLRGIYLVDQMKVFGVACQIVVEKEKRGETPFSDQEGALTKIALTTMERKIT